MVVHVCSIRITYQVFIRWLRISNYQYRSRLSIRYQLGISHSHAARLIDFQSPGSVNAPSLYDFSTPESYIRHLKATRGLARACRQYAKLHTASQILPSIGGLTSAFPSRQRRVERACRPDVQVLTNTVLWTKVRLCYYLRLILSDSRSSYCSICSQVVNLGPCSQHLPLPTISKQGTDNLLPHTRPCGGYTESGYHEFTPEYSMTCINPTDR